MTWSGALRLAAAPTFLFMAVLTGVLDRGPAAMLCGAASPISGMVPMYLLMSAFHAPPWLKRSAKPLPEGEGGEKRGDRSGKPEISALPHPPSY
ncbi:MAG TPA: hypothetical protein VGF33_07155 [Caulobacteraceae bacterium]|jgi:hypothetical protein